MGYDPLAKSEDLSAPGQSGSAPHTSPWPLLADSVEKVPSTGARQTSSKHAETYNRPLLASRFDLKRCTSRRGPNNEAPDPCSKISPMTRKKLARLRRRTFSTELVKSRHRAVAPLGCASGKGCRGYFRTSGNVSNLTTELPPGRAESCSELVATMPSAGETQKKSDFEVRLAASATARGLNVSVFPGGTL